MEQGQRAVEVVELMAAVADSLKVGHPAGDLICTALARATGAEEAVWVALRDDEEPEVIGTHPDPVGAQNLAKVVLSAILPQAQADPLRARLAKVGEVLYLAPGETSDCGFSGAQRVLAMSKRKGFTEADEELAKEMIPAMTMMLPQVIATSEQKRREVARASVARELGLTERELEVLQLLARGLLATSIASRLSLSPRTVHKHLGNIYEKMGVHDRLVAVSLARRRGLVDEEA